MCPHLGFRLIACAAQAKKGCGALRGFCFNLLIFTLLLCAHSEGNAFFKNKQYKDAIEKYTEAIAADHSDVTFFSNRR